MVSQGVSSRLKASQGLSKSLKRLKESQRDSQRLIEILTYLSRGQGLQKDFESCFIGNSFELIIDTLIDIFKTISKSIRKLKMH